LLLARRAAAAPVLPPRDFESAEAGDEAGLRVPQADLQRLGARPERRLHGTAFRI
jgi:hypothetical protein